jgi:O-antigen ligase
MFSRRAWTALAALFVLAVVLFVAVPDLGENVLGRLDTDRTANSDQGHWDFLVMALEMVPRSHYVGVGLGNYEALTGIQHAHNVFATVAAELGLVGLLLLLLWVGATLWCGACAVHLSAPRTLVRDASVGFLAAIVSILVNNLFQFSFYAGFVWMISGVIGALYYVARSQSGTRSLEHGERQTDDGA